MEQKQNERSSDSTWETTSRRQRWTPQANYVCFRIELTTETAVCLFLENTIFVSQANIVSHFSSINQHRTSTKTQNVQQNKFDALALPSSALQCL